MQNEIFSCVILGFNREEAKLGYYEDSSGTLPLLIFRKRYLTHIWSKYLDYASECLTMVDTFILSPYQI